MGNSRMVSGFDASSSRFRFYCDINVTLMGLRLDYYDYGIKLSFIRNKKKRCLNIERNKEYIQIIIQIINKKENKVAKTPL